MKKKTLKIATIAIMISIITLTIGFSAFSNDLSISQINAKIKVKKDIRISNITIKKASSNTEVAYADFNVKNIDAGIKLNDNGAYAIFDVEITNLGNVEMGIFSIINHNSNLDYEIVNKDYLSDQSHNYQDYKLKTMLTDDTDHDLTKLGVKTHLLIKVSKKDGANIQSGEINQVNLEFSFREMYKVNYNSIFASYMTTEKINHVIKGETLSVGVNYSDISNIYVNSDRTPLVPDYGYTLENNTLTIPDVAGNLAIGITEEKTNYGLTIKSNWLSSNSVEITLNGKVTTPVYIRLRDGDTYIAANAGELYSASYASTPIYVASASKPKNVYITYEYVSGTYTAQSGAAITIKYRDATKNCNQVRTAELIANYSSQNFKLNETFTNQGSLTQSVSQISAYSNIGNEFNNLKFIITYGEN